MCIAVCMSIVVSVLIYILGHGVYILDFSALKMSFIFKCDVKDMEKCDA
jgi:hypothetical protein